MTADDTYYQALFVQPQQGVVFIDFEHGVDNVAWLQAQTEMNMLFPEDEDEEPYEDYNDDPYDLQNFGIGYPVTTEPTSFNVNQILHPSTVGSLPKTLSRYNQSVGTVLNSLMTPMSQAFDSSPTELLAILQKRFPNAKASQFESLLVYPSKIRDFAITIKEILAIDHKVIAAQYDDYFLEALGDVNYLNQTSVADFFAGLKFPLSKDNLNNSSIQSSLDKFKSENSLGFIFRCMIFSKILFPIYSDPYKAPVGYVNIKELDKSYQPFLFHCPMPYYDEVVGLYPAFIQIIMTALQQTLISTCTDARAGVTELVNSLEKAKQDLVISNNSSFVEFVSPYNWS